MSLELRKTGTAEYGRFIKALIVGEPGSGKTLISSTFPRPIYASAEGGLMSIADRNIPYVEIRNTEQLLELRVMLDNDPQTRTKVFGAPIETVVIDTIDEIQRVFIRERLENEKKQVLQLQDWGWLGEQMQAFVRGFRNLEMNVVFACHVKETRDDELGRIVYKPGLQGAIGDQIAGYVDLSLRLASQTKTVVEDETAKRVIERTLITFPDSQHPWVKDRSGKLPPELEVNFKDDFKRIHKLIFGDIEVQEAQEEALSVQPEPEVQEEPEIQEPEGLTEVSIPDGSEPKFACTECGAIFYDADQATLSKIRARKVMCASCYKNR